MKRDTKNLRGSAGAYIHGRGEKQIHYNNGEYKYKYKWGDSQAHHTTHSLSHKMIHTSEEEVDPHKTLTGVYILLFLSLKLSQELSLNRQRGETSSMAYSHYSTKGSNNASSCEH